MNNNKEVKSVSKRTVNNNKIRVISPNYKGIIKFLLHHSQYYELFVFFILP